MFRPQLYDYHSVRAKAKKRLPWMVFDYIDGAAGEGKGVDANRSAIDAFKLSPRILRNVSSRDLSMSIFGNNTSLPFGISPMGMCNLAHPMADQSFAEISAKTGMPVGLSSFGSTDLETMYRRSDGNAWFQLYFSGDGTNSMALANRAQDAGYKTLVITLDVPEVGYRPRELRHGFTMPFRIGPSQFFDFVCHPCWSSRAILNGAPRLANFDKPGFDLDRTESRAAADWEFFKSLRNSWKGKLVVKGVTNVKDAKRLTGEGADAIQVSSHGSRQLEGGIPPFHALQEIRASIGNDFPLFYDSGIQSGEDVVRAYLAGANFVFIGRYMQFAAAAGGRTGVNKVVSFLENQISNVIAQLGVTSILELKQTVNSL